MSFSEDLTEKGSPFLRSGKTKRSPETHSQTLTPTQELTNKRLLSPNGENEELVDKRSRIDYPIEYENSDSEIEEIENPSEVNPNPKRRSLLAEGLAATENLKRLASNCEKSSKCMTSTRAKSMLETVVTLENIIHQLSEIAFANTLNSRTFETLEKHILSIKNDIQKQPQPTYATATKNIPVHKQEGTKPARSTILIYPKEGMNTTSEETRDKVKAMIQPKDLKLKVSRVNKIRNGGIVMEIDKDQVKAVKEIIQKDLDIRNPKKRNPYIKIFDVPRNMTVDELCKATYEQNLAGGDITESDFKMEFKPAYKTGPRNDNHVQWVVEVSPKIRKKLISVGRLFIEWSSLKVVDHCAISRCYRCQRYGHLAKDCKGVETCSHCAGEGHGFKDCTNKKQGPKCINCQKSRMNHNHAANSEKCATFLRERARMLEKTNYES